MSYNLSHNLDALTAMASNLTPYLYEDELFGHLGNRLPKLTVGGLLMRLHQLEYLEENLDSEQRQDLHDAHMNLDAARNEWAMHFEQKILKEIESRLGSIRWFLDDCARDPGSCYGGWRNEVEKRTIVQHLINEAKRLEILTDDLKGEVAQVDSRLRTHFDSGDFVWDDELQDAYPQNEYWWLYGFAKNES
jgi:hypothetical protein